MVNVVQGGENAVRNYPTPEFKWDDDIHMAHVVLPLERFVVRGEQQIGTSVPYYDETLLQFALMSEAANQIVPDWHKPVIGRTHHVSRRGPAVNASESIRQRLANANDYFHRKATEVFNDESALELLVKMYQDVVWDITDFDACQNGIALAKLTAANFAEVGANVIYITEAGQRFIDSVREQGHISG
jgi:hypothetical protein